ncbi:6600_t:CDS:2 [Ambispora gerdemannii]|uniref:6600_t:CDS:1 n=1 Tax=Ambispora gerdemannii TaxID=144530 RepID=A0A9N9CY43_9GLOM|nr:6600_t:CDS:2 [Ambispora gerdemannii]
MAYCFLDGIGTGKNEKEYFEWTKKYAETGSPMGYFKIGESFEYGIGTRVDFQSAFRWHEKSAHANNPFGQLHLAALYDAGLGTEKNPSLAFEWMKKAATTEGNNSEAHYYLALYYFSALLGDPDAAYYLGKLYFNGQGIDVHQNKAFRAWMKATHLECAKHQLAVCYDDGEDYNIALFFFFIRLTNSDAKSYMYMYLRLALIIASTDELALGFENAAKLFPKRTGMPVSD